MPQQHESYLWSPQELIHVRHITSLPCSNVILLWLVGWLPGKVERTNALFGKRDLVNLDGLYLVSHVIDLGLVRLLGELTRTVDYILRFLRRRPVFLNRLFHLLRNPITLRNRVTRPSTRQITKLGHPRRPLGRIFVLTLTFTNRNNDLFNLLFD